MVECEGVGGLVWVSEMRRMRVLVVFVLEVIVGVCLVLEV